MSIQFCGVPLCLMDPEGELSSHIERVLSLEDTRLFGEDTVAARAGNFNSMTNEAPRIGLPLPNWPAQPRMKVNTLWWPTGATRWARGLFLASAAQMAQIWDAAGGTKGSGGIVAAGGNPSFGELLIEDLTSGQSVTTNMYLLPPRPITYGGGNYAAYLVPLVDERYLWQFKDADDLSMINTWAELKTALEAILGTVTWDAPASGFALPDWEICRSYENAAVILDAMAYSVGKRVVRTMDGSVSLLSGGQSQTYLSSSYRNSAAKVLAGDIPSGMRANVLPQTIRVAFPALYYQTREPTNGYYVVDTSPDGNDGLQGAASVVTIFSTASALYTGSTYPPDVTDDPDNKTEVDALAAAIAAAYEAYTGDTYDISLVGINWLWPLNGFDDFVWFHFGYLYPDKANKESPNSIIQGDYAAYTRVCSLPYNVGTPVQYQQFSDVMPGHYPLPLWFKLTHDWGYADAGQASANPGEWDPTADGSLSADTGHEVTVTDTTGNRTGGNETWVQARPIGSENGVVWEVVGSGGGSVPMYEGTLPSALVETDEYKDGCTLHDDATGEELTNQRVYNRRNPSNGGGFAGVTGTTFWAKKGKAGVFADKIVMTDMSCPAP